MQPWRSISILNRRQRQMSWLWCLTASLLWTNKVVLLLCGVNLFLSWDVSIDGYRILLQLLLSLPSHSSLSSVSLSLLIIPWFIVILYGSRQSHRHPSRTHPWMMIVIITIIQRDRPQSSIYKNIVPQDSIRLMSPQSLQSYYCYSCSTAADGGFSQGFKIDTPLLMKNILWQPDCPG